MKRWKAFLFFLMVIATPSLMAQNTPFRLKTGLGLATYFGDLKEKTKIIDQSSLAFNLGLTYDITDQIIGRLDFGLMSLKADDRFNTRIDFINRNLNFKTTLWEINAGVEYDFLNMRSEDYFFTPYFHIGLGISHFNPWTYDRTGEKRFLRDFGTEGQGLPSYPERKPYSLIGFQIPIGAGIKLAITENIIFWSELEFRKLFTDHLDDVGNTYPDRNTVLNESKTPQTTIGLTYRGDEISNQPYPGVNINRGGYTKDIFYTFSIGLSFKLENLTIGNGRNSRSRRSSGGGRSPRSKVRSPGSVF
jgi:Domain of unknown function (DUF6089)